MATADTFKLLFHSSRLMAFVLVHSPDSHNEYIAYRSVEIQKLLQFSVHFNKKF
jgi:hypothetical protein